MRRKIPAVSITALWESYGGEVVGPDRTTERKAKCALPDHDDRTPSASVNEDEGLWFCPVCDRGGDAIKLIEEVHGTRFNDSLAILAKFAEGGGGQVSPRRSGSSLLPRGSRNHGAAGGFVPPWSRL